MNVEATLLVLVKVEIKQGQGWGSKLGLGLATHRKELIRNKELKNRGNSNMNHY
jgi:hypothetical protein